MCGNKKNILPKLFGDWNTNMEFVKFCKTLFLKFQIKHKSNI